MLSKQWAKFSFLNVLEHFGIRVLDALLTIGLVRVFSAPEFGLFSVYQSWVSIILIFLPSLEVVLYRDYRKYKDTGEFESKLSLFYTFAVLKVIFGVLFCTGFFLVSSPESNSDGFLILLIAASIPLATSMFGVFRETLRFELHQTRALVLSVIYRVALLGIVIIALGASSHKLTLLGFGFLAVFIGGFYFWQLEVHRALPKFRFSLSANFLSETADIFFKTVLWTHLIGVCLSATQTLDTFFLNYHRNDISEIGRYSLALKLANFFQMIPLALVNSFGVYLGRAGEEQKSKGLVWKLVGVSLASGILMYYVFLEYSVPMMDWIGRGKFDTESLLRAKEYFRYQLAGVVILCASFPMSTYLTAKANLRKLAIYVFLPWAGFTAGIYYWSTSVSPLQAARANVLVYALHLLGLFVALKWFTRRRSSSLK